MDSQAIRVRDIGKFYRMYQKPSHLFWELARRTPMHIEKHVLSEISFNVARGEVVGIIGPNGAGKSTLLSIIAGTLQQSTGEVHVDGTLTAILELGTGFNPEQTGRQNVYLGGIATGMTRKEVDAKIDDIVAFSELEDVIDQPFKTYSSGMQARLTFSTAISVEPDILIIDEALAAGDSAFVQKCLRRVEQIVTSGSTVLLVSHSTSIITRFASRAVWLDKGRIVEVGDSETVCKHYEVDTYNRVTAYENIEKKAEPNLTTSFAGGLGADLVTELPEDQEAAVEAGAPQTADSEKGAGDQRIRIVNLEIEAESVDDGVYAFGSDFTFHFDIESDIAATGVGMYLAIQRRDDNVMAWTATTYRHIGEDYALTVVGIDVTPGSGRISVEATGLGLNRGLYYVDAGIEPRPKTVAIADYHDFQPRLRHFSIVHPDDNEQLTQVFMSPTQWIGSGCIAVTHGAIESF